MPSMIDAWLSASEMIASSSPSRVSPAWPKAIMRSLTTFFMASRAGFR
jgi:hypothetical protein